MKNIFAITLLTVTLATPAFADDVAATAAAKKTASAPPSAGPHDHKKEGKNDKCAAEKGMGDYHPHGMMGEPGSAMMMEPDMHLLGALALSKDQQAKINKLSDELKHNNWATLGLMNDETAKLRDLYEADKRDPVAIGKEYQKVFDLKRQLIESYLDTQNRIEEVLTPEQLAKLKNARHEMHHMHGHSMQ